MSETILDTIEMISKKLNPLNFKERRFILKTLKEWNELIDKRNRRMAFARFEFKELVERLDIKYEK